jgi:hypothetical protein
MRYFINLIILLSFSAATFSMEQPTKKEVVRCLNGDDLKNILQSDQGTVLNQVTEDLKSLICRTLDDNNSKNAFGLYDEYYYGALSGQEAQQVMSDWVSGGLIQYGSMIIRDSSSHIQDDSGIQCRTITYFNKNEYWHVRIYYVPLKGYALSDPKADRYYPSFFATIQALAEKEEMQIHLLRKKQ